MHIGETMTAMGVRLVLGVYCAVSMKTDRVIEIVVKHWEKKKIQLRFKVPSIFHRHL